MSVSVSVIPDTGNKVSKFKIFWNQSLGEGSFGKVYLAQNTETFKFFAVKTQDNTIDEKLLQSESNIIKYLTQQPTNQPVIYNYHYIKTPNCSFLVTDLLGPSLESLLKSCGGKFSLKTVLMIAEQVIQRIKFCHERNIIHRDIKPDNFLTDYERPQKNIYLIDFGLSKKYFGKAGHIQYRENRPHIGTARYMSVNAHEKKEQSRRDDMYSIGYMLIYFATGKLPWQGLFEQNKKKRYQRICQLKKETSNDELTRYICCDKCTASCPAQSCFKKYFDYLDSLEFSSDVNHNFLIHEFLVCMEKHQLKYDYIWDWTSAGSGAGSGGGGHAVSLSSPVSSTSATPESASQPKTSNSAAQ